MAQAFLSSTSIASLWAGPVCEFGSRFKLQPPARQLSSFQSPAVSHMLAKGRGRRTARGRQVFAALCTPEETVPNKEDDQSSTDVGFIGASVSSTPEKIEPAILLTEKATVHLRKLKAENDALCLRIGVRKGGCSGMSYMMDFEDQSKVRADDSIIEADGIKLVCDPKSLLFLFGMQLDYNDALIGGGFSFNNPNATSSCGCGKSFAA